MIFLLAAAVVLLLADIIYNRATAESFTPPPHESAAESGTPTVSDDMGYTELYQEGMAYSVSICGVPKADGNSLTLYFTNLAENTCALKLRIYNENDVLLGETGLLSPGEFVRTVQLSESITPDTPLKLKIMSYDPDTYESVGSVVLNVTTQ